jgi:hypothetical protein
MISHLEWMAFFVLCMHVDIQYAQYSSCLFVFIIIIEICTYHARM